MIGFEFAVVFPWWSDQMAGVIGGIAGSVLGIFGGLTGWLAGQGKALGFFIKAWQVLFILGIASLIAGTAAIVLGQPYAVYYPLLLLGFLVSILSPTLIKLMRRRVADTETRRMNAFDAE